MEGAGNLRALSRTAVAISASLLLLGGCAGSDGGSSGNGGGLPASDGSGTDWVGGWTCSGLEETFIAGDPASDVLHDWTDEDVKAAHAEYANRC